MMNRIMLMRLLKRCILKKRDLSREKNTNEHPCLFPTDGLLQLQREVKNTVQYGMMHRNTERGYDKELCTEAQREGME
jgi:hypothetical protein